MAGSKILNMKVQVKPKARIYIDKIVEPNVKTQVLDNNTRLIHPFP
jgi:hypothetical protein